MQQFLVPSCAPAAATASRMGGLVRPGSGSRIPRGSLPAQILPKFCNAPRKSWDGGYNHPVQVSCSRTFLPSHWSSVGGPANGRRIRAVVDFPQPGSLHRPGKTWSDAGLGLLGPRHKPARVFASACPLSLSSRVGNSRKLNEGNLHKTCRLSHYTKNCPRHSLHRHTICNIR